MNYAPFCQGGGWVGITNWTFLHKCECINNIKVKVEYKRSELPQFIYCLISWVLSSTMVCWCSTWEMQFVRVTGEGWSSLAWECTLLYWRHTKRTQYSFEALYLWCPCGRSTMIPQLLQAAIQQTRDSHKNLFVCTAHAYINDIITILKITSVSIQYSI